MDNLIKILQTEHKILLKEFNSIPTKKGTKIQFKQLQKMRNLLTEHMKKESSRLYPRLLSAKSEEIRRVGGNIL